MFSTQFTKKIKLTIVSTNFLCTNIALIPRYTDEHISKNFPHIMPTASRRKIKNVPKTLDFQDFPRSRTKLAEIFPQPNDEKHQKTKSGYGNCRRRSHLALLQKREKFHFFYPLLLTHQPLVSSSPALEQKKKNRKPR